MAHRMPRPRWGKPTAETGDTNSNQAGLNGAGPSCTGPTCSDPNCTESNCVRLAKAIKEAGDAAVAALPPIDVPRPALPPYVDLDGDYSGQVDRFPAD